MYECCDCGRKHLEGAKRFSDDEKELAVRLRMDGSSLSAAARAVGTSATTADAWIEKRGPGEADAEGADEQVRGGQLGRNRGETGVF